MWGCKSQTCLKILLTFGPRRRATATAATTATTTTTTTATTTAAATTTGAQHWLENNMFWRNGNGKNKKVCENNSGGSDTKRSFDNSISNMKEAKTNSWRNCNNKSNLINRNVSYTWNAIPTTELNAATTAAITSTTKASMTKLEIVDGILISENYKKIFMLNHYHVAIIDLSIKINV